MKVVLPSVHYADFLRETLPAWQAMLPRGSFVVVTSPDDTETQLVAREAGAELCVTTVWLRGGVFNKAAALDLAFGLTAGFAKPPKRDEVCVALDADVYPFGRFPRTKHLRADTIYSCPRYVCDSPAALEAHRAGQTALDDCLLIPPLDRGAGSVAVPHSTKAAARAARRCLGYVQVFRHQPARRFGESSTAGGYDIRFRNQFPSRGILPGFYVFHLGERSRRNWRGRTVPAWTAA